MEFTTTKTPFYFYNNTAEVYFTWAEDSILVREEYLLMDFGAIVSAVGGSLGLFLGFSCLDFILRILAKTEARLSNFK